MGDYTAFYEALDMRIDPDDIKTYNQLRTLLDKYGFNTTGRQGDSPRTVRQKNDKITQKAWEHLKGHAVSMETRKALTTEKKSKRRYDKVLNYDIEFKGKEYKRGSPPPKDMPEYPYKFIPRDNRIPVKQALVTITYKGKKYRKGQFLPKDFKVT